MKRTATKNINNWPRQPLKNIATVLKGKKPSSFISGHQGTLPYLEAGVLRERRSPRYVSCEEVTRLVIAEDTDTLILWDGYAGDIFEGRSGVVASTMARVRVSSRNIHPKFLYYYLLFSSPRLRETATGTTVRHVRSRMLKDLPIPMPPLPVQERIVEILQKAEEIHRKRQEALEIGKDILKSAFHEIIGDPVHNSKGWPLRKIGTFCKVVRGAHPRPAGDPRFFGGGIPIAYIADVTASPSRFLNETKLTVTKEGMRKSRFLKEGTLVVTGNTTTGIPKILGMDCCVHDGFRAFVDLNEEVERDYLYWYFKYTVDYYESLTPGAGLRGGLRTEDYEKFEIPFPPLPIQRYLALVLNKAEDNLNRLRVSAIIQEDIISGLLACAFTGELTAEWEKANTEWIAKQVEFHEQLPRLILLAFLRERANRAGRKAKEAAILVTAMMKYAFLLQMESNCRRRLYQFVPYYYGPFAKDLYADLENLHEDGLVTLNNVTDEDNTRIILADFAKADDALAVLPNDLKEDISAVLNTYGDLDHNALLKTVYEKYPAYAKKSRIHKARKAFSAGKKRARRPEK